MTNRIAFFLGLFILILIGADYIFFGTEHFLFLAKKLMDLIEYIAFWR
ncbi:hypothetical protein PGB28_00205 [Primorskyibacter aestuariivivens]|nr:hypothetical protein [Primorskyibacter aestuariivivens]MDA7426860.1 hypothetical protein [Primorskyibacter aestuariivivens]